MALCAVLAIGGVVLAPVKAYAAATERRTPLTVGLDNAAVDSPGPAATGSGLFMGNRRSVDNGVTWSSDAPSNTWYAGAGTLIGLVGGNPLLVTSYDVATNVTTTFPTPIPQYPSSINTTWALFTVGGHVQAQNLVTGAPLVQLIEPSGAATSFSTAALTSSDGVLWRGSMGGENYVAYAATPTSTPGAWVRYTGASGLDVDGTTLDYGVLTNPGLKLCSLPLTSLSSPPTCTQVSSSSHTEVQISAHGGWALVSVDPYFGASEMYAWAGSRATRLQLPAGSSLSTFSGDDAAGLLRTNGRPAGIVRVASSGALGPQLPLPTAPAVPKLLAVAAGRILGADARTSSSVQSAWSRSVSGSAIGTESPLSNPSGSDTTDRWASISVSGARTLVVPDWYASIYDRGVLGLTVNGFAGSVQISGPFATVQNLSGVNMSIGADVESDILFADGTRLLPVTGNVALFGSRLATPKWSANGAVTMMVRDLTGKKPDRTTDLTTTTTCTTVGYPNDTVKIWNDVFVPVCDGSSVTVNSLATGAVLHTLVGDPGGTLTAVDVGDGYVIVKSGRGAYKVWDLASDTLIPLTDCTADVNPASDGVGHIACASATDLVWQDFSALSTSPGRVLGWIAPNSLATGSWTPQIDVTKPFSAGALRIREGTTVVREIAVPASADGSVRGVSWDGNDAAGHPVPATDFTAELVVSATDGSGLVRAIDGVSPPTFQVTPPTAGTFTGVWPWRLLDTRVDAGGSGPVAANGVVDVQVTGRGGVPADYVGAVVLNVTAVTPTGSGYLTVYPSGSAAPWASNLNFMPGQVVPNLVVAKVGTNGKVSIRNGSAGTTEVVVDVTGWFAAGTVVDPGGVTSLPPSRILDTRVASGGTGPVAPTGTVKVQVTGRGGVPSTGVSAVIVNLTAVTPTAPGFLTAYPTGVTAPLASSVNFVSGQVVPNLAFVKLGADGSFTVLNGSSGRTELVVDVAGYVTSGTVTRSGMYVAITPARILDTRSTGQAASVQQVQVAGAGGVPATGTSGAVLNVTVVAGTAPGFLTVYPGDEPAPWASNVNFVPRQVVPNLVAVRTSPTGEVLIRNVGWQTSQVVVDVAGYFTA